MRKNTRGLRLQNNVPAREFYQIGMSANQGGISVYIPGIKDKTYLAKTYGKKLGKASVTGDVVQANPVTGMREFGSHSQAAGTWSDDGSLILCTADSLVTHEFNLADMGGRFVRWMNDGLWTARGDAFDVDCLF